MRPVLESLLLNPSELNSSCYYLLFVLKTNIPDFRSTEMEVFRRFSDFLGLHEKLVEKHLHRGRIIPPPPEKSVIGMLSTGCMWIRCNLAEFVVCLVSIPVASVLVSSIINM